MKYPRANNYLMYQRTGQDTCRITDFSEDGAVLEVDMETARFLRRLDGKTAPGKCLHGASGAEVKEVLEVLRENGLLRDHGRLLFGGPGSVKMTLWIPGMKFQRSFFPVIWNFLLLLTWLPFAGIGMFLFLREPEAYMEVVNHFELQIFGGLIVGLLAGMAIHEMSHGAASMCYGVKVFEFGVFVDFFMPGAYSDLEYKLARKRWHRIQILGAGIESNFWLAGFCLMIGKVFPGAGLFFMMSAFSNAILGLSNLNFWRMPDGGMLDGMLIFQEILGTDHFFQEAFDAVFNWRKRIKIKQKMGLSGYALILLYGAVLFYQITVPLSIVSNILLFYK